MPYARILFTAIVYLVPLTMASAQVPDDLRTVMLARDTAVAQANVASWDRLTSSTFTVVTSDGRILTKTERIAELKTQSAGPVLSRSREVARRYGDVYVVRSLANGEWFLDVWEKENGQWKVAAVQVTSVRK